MDYTQDTKNKKRRFSSDELNQGDSGGQGAALGNANGFGDTANSLGQPKNFFKELPGAGGEGLSSYIKEGYNKATSTKEVSPNKLAANIDQAINGVNKTPVDIKTTPLNSERFPKNNIETENTTKPSLGKNQIDFDKGFSFSDGQGGTGFIRRTGKGIDNDAALRRLKYGSNYEGDMVQGEVRRPDRSLEAGGPTLADRITYDANPEVKARRAQDVATAEDRKYKALVDQILRREREVARQNDASSPYLVSDAQVRKNMLNTLGDNSQPSINDQFQRKLTEGKIDDAISKGHTRTAGLLMDRLNSQDELSQRRDQAQLGASVDIARINQTASLAAESRQADLEAAKYSSDSRLKADLEDQLYKRASLGATVAKDKSNVLLEGEKLDSDRASKVYKALADAETAGIRITPASRASIFKSMNVGVSDSTLPSILQENFEEYMGLPASEKPGYLKRLGVL